MYFLTLDYLNDNGLMPSNVDSYYFKATYRNQDDYKLIMDAIPKNFFAGIDFRNCIFAKRPSSSELKEVYGLFETLVQYEEDEKSNVPTEKGWKAILDLLGLEEHPNTLKRKNEQKISLIQGIQVYEDFSLLPIEEKRIQLKEMVKEKFLKSNKIILTTLNKTVSIKELSDNNFIKNIASEFDLSPLMLSRVEAEAKKSLDIYMDQLTKLEKSIDGYSELELIQRWMEENIKSFDYSLIDHYKYNKLVENISSVIDLYKYSNIFDIIHNLNGATSSSLSYYLTRFEKINLEYEKYKEFFNSEQCKLYEEKYDEYYALLQEEKKTPLYRMGNFSHELMSRQSELNELLSKLPFDIIPSDLKTFKTNYTFDINKFKFEIFDELEAELTNLRNKIISVEKIREQIDVDNELKNAEILKNFILQPGHVGISMGMPINKYEMIPYREEIIKDLMGDYEFTEETSENSPKTM